ncbi:MAG: lysophospholipid acyltransferase family protein [Bdellovibrionales bacterium]|jgi:1-acyl-sn-glycerol-3-phosphate acyltransferase|nr:lysophospholipid acyltransferase family protein [Bdellovibrionales bacterium]
MMKVFVFTYTLLRALLSLVLVPYWTVVHGVAVLYNGSKGNQQAVTWHMSRWCQKLLRYFGVDVKMEGFEKLPRQGGGVLAFNHQSHFDIPAVMASADRVIRYGAKAELFKIPLFGAAIRMSGCLPIARQNRTAVFRIYEEASNRFREGVIFALAPEGTRQAKPEIGPFKKGPFFFAANSGVPIVPVVIEGADRVLPKGQLLPNIGHLRQTIQVRVLDPVWPNRRPTIGPDGSPTVPNETITLLLEETRAQMVRAFADLKAQRNR